MLKFKRLGRILRNRVGPVSAGCRWKVECAMALRFYGSGAAAVFAPLESLSRSELVARRLIDAIALGLLPDAEQLPGEADLAGIFGVSTTTIREALSALRLRGLIETRRGRGGGSFVRAQEEMSTAIVRGRLDELSLAQ